LGELLRRFRYPLAYLLLSALCVISMVTERRHAPLDPASRALVALTVPLERMVTLPVHEIRGWWDELVVLVQVREQNDQLRQHIARLEEENLQYREAIVSSERFQRLAGFRESHEVPMVPANVVHQDLSPWFRSVIIDQGTAAGIRPGMPVVTDLGVVGVVSGTAPSASKVLLLIDPQSHVDAYVQRSRARGSVRGAKGRECSFEFVLRDEDLAVGDLLLTSGMGEVFPKGLVIGHVTSVERRPYGLFQEAQIKPAVDFGKLEEVFVILEQRELPEDDAFDSEDDGLWAVPEIPAPAGPTQAPAAPAPGPEAQAER
jgi:rod shape-determining protein MreC